MHKLSGNTKFYRNSEIDFCFSFTDLPNVCILHVIFLLLNSPARFIGYTETWIKSMLILFYINIQINLASNIFPVQLSNQGWHQSSILTSSKYAVTFTFWNPRESKIEHYSGTLNSGALGE